MRYLVWTCLALVFFVGCDSETATVNPERQSEEVCPGDAKCLKLARWEISSERHPLRFKVMLKVDGQVVFDECQGTVPWPHVSVNLTRTQIIIAQEARMPVLGGRRRLGLELQAWDTACTFLGPFYESDDTPYIIRSGGAQTVVSIDLDR